jgi:hypothetical protein
MSQATHTPTTELLQEQLVIVKSRKAEDQEKEKQAIFAKFSEHQAQAKKAAAEKRNQLMSVQIDRSESATLAQEFGISKEHADLVLRENGGNFEAAVNHLLVTKPTLAL